MGIERTTTRISIGTDGYRASFVATGDTDGGFVVGTDGGTISGIAINGAIAALRAAGIAVDGYDDADEPTGGTTDGGDGQSPESQSRTIDHGRAHRHIAAANAIDAAERAEGIGIATGIGGGEAHRAAADAIIRGDAAGAARIEQEAGIGATGDGGDEESPVLSLVAVLGLLVASLAATATRQAEQDTRIARAHAASNRAAAIRAARSRR